MGNKHHGGVDRHPVVKPPPGPARPPAPRHYVGDNRPRPSAPSGLTPQSIIHRDRDEWLAVASGTGWDSVTPVGPPPQAALPLSAVTFVPVAEVPQVLCDKYSPAAWKNIRALFLYLPLVFLVSKEVERFMADVLDALSRRGEAVPMLKQALSEELDACASSSVWSWFRGNVIVTRLVTIFFKQAGRPYLQLALGPVLRALVEGNQELAPSFSNGIREVSAEDAERLKRLCDKCLTGFEGQLPSLPTSIRIICSHIRDESTKRMPPRQGVEDDALRIAASFFVLRFACPPMLVLEQYVPASVTQGKTPIPVETRRAAVLVAKTFQMLAFRTPFNEQKEPLSVLNPWLPFDRMRRLLLSACRVTPSSLKALCISHIRSHLSAYEPRLGALPLELRDYCTSTSLDLPDENPDLEI